MVMAAIGATTALAVMLEFLKSLISESLLPTSGFGAMKQGLDLMQALAMITQRVEEAPAGFKCAGVIP